MDKRELSEEDIKLQFITPAIEQAGWDKHSQIRMEVYFTDGKVIVRGNVTSRGKRKKADYILSYNRVSIATAALGKVVKIIGSTNGKE